MARSDMPDRYRKEDEAPIGLRLEAGKIKLSKDGTKYVYNFHVEADPNSKAKYAIEVANDLLEKVKRLESQVLNIKKLKKGSRINVGMIFARVGEILLNKAKAETSKITLSDKDKNITEIFVASTEKEMIQKLVTLLDMDENEHDS